MKICHNYHLTLRFLIYYLGLDKPVDIPQRNSYYLFYYRIFF